MTGVTRSLCLVGIFVLSGLAAPGVLARAGDAVEPPSNPQHPLFDFHSGLWINLHHFLYEEAATQAEGSQPVRHEPLAAEDLAIAAELSPDEQQIWSSAIAYYETHFLQRDLLTNDMMRSIKNRLEDSEDAPTLVRSRLDPSLAAVLNRAAPVYRAHWWQAHDRANHLWIAGVSPLIDQHGKALSEKLSVAFGAPWPDRPIRVDVVAYANWAGAYTTLLPSRIAISSLDARNQQTAALEVVFHEASHTLIERVGDTLIRDFAARRKSAPRDLWHALLFFTVGFYVQQIYPDYVPYAKSNDLWERGFSSPFYEVLAADWQPHLEGKKSLAQALSDLVGDLSTPATKTQPGTSGQP